MIITIGLNMNITLSLTNNTVIGFRTEYYNVYRFAASKVPNHRLSVHEYDQTYLRSELLKHGIIYSLDNYHNPQFTLDEELLTFILLSENYV